MVDDSPSHHWVRLSGGCDVEIRHGVPVSISDNGERNTVSPENLAREISEITGLDIQLGPWIPGAEPDESVARVVVSPEQLVQVLDRFARSSAVLFVDRFHKAIDENDVDWDREEFGVDFNDALKCCSLARGDVDPEAYFENYATVMHEETKRLMQASR